MIEYFIANALFVYNRLWHVQHRCGVAKNALASGSDLYVFSDAARDEHSTEQSGRYLSA